MTNGQHMGGKNWDAFEQGRITLLRRFSNRRTIRTILDVLQANGRGQWLPRAPAARPGRTGRDLMVKNAHKDQIRLITRIVAAIVVPFLVLAFFILYFYWDVFDPNHFPFPLWTGLCVVTPFLVQLVWLWKVGLQSIGLWHLLVVVAAFVRRSDFTNDPGNWYLVSVIVVLVGMHLLYLMMEGERRSWGDERAPRDTRQREPLATGDRV